MTVEAAEQLKRVTTDQWHAAWFVCGVIVGGSSIAFFARAHEQATVERLVRQSVDRSEEQLRQGRCAESCGEPYPDVIRVLPGDGQFKCLCADNRVFVKKDGLMR